MYLNHLGEALLYGDVLLMFHMNEIGCLQRKVCNMKAICATKNNVSKSGANKLIRPN